MLCLALAALKLMLALPWSWWRVLLPLWVVLWHNAMYIAVGFIWLTWMNKGRGGHDLTIRRDHKLNRYQFGSMAFALILLDNVLRKIGGPGESVWWWLASGRTEVIVFSAVLMFTCQFLFWSGIVLSGNVQLVNPRRGTTSRLNHR